MPFGATGCGAEAAGLVEGSLSSSVISTDPQDYATDVSFDTSVAFTFAEGTDPSAGLHPEFELVAPDGGVVNGDLSFEVASRTCTFFSNAPLFSGSMYVGRVVTTAVGGSAEAPITAEYAWIFTTRSDPRASPLVADTLTPS